MASGDSVVLIVREIPPVTSYAQIEQIDGGSSPNEAVIVWAFDAASDEYIDLLCELNGYDGGGLTIKIKYSMASATSGSVVWTAGIRRFDENSEDLDASKSYTFLSTTDTVPGTSTGRVGYATITMTDGANMDSLADGETFILRIARDADNGSDNAAGDAYLWAVIGLET